MPEEPARSIVDVTYACESCGAIRTTPAYADEVQPELNTCAADGGRFLLVVS